MKIIKTAKYIKKSQPWSFTDAQDASIDMPEPGVRGDTLLSWVDEITSGGYVGVDSALEEWLENGGHQTDRIVPRDPTEMENKIDSLVQRIKQIAEKRGSMSLDQIKQDRYEGENEDYHEGLRKDRQMGIASSKKNIKTAQEDGYYYYSQIYKTVQEIETDFAKELKQMKAHVTSIGDLEAEIINLSQQGGATEGQDYYGSDYISQTLAGDQSLQILRNDELEERSIWSINEVLQAYEKSLNRILRDLKWDTRDQNDPNTPQDKWLFRG